MSVFCPKQPLSILNLTIIDKENQYNPRIVLFDSISMQPKTVEISEWKTSPKAVPGGTWGHTSLEDKNEIPANPDMTELLDCFEKKCQWAVGESKSKAKTRFQMLVSPLETPNAAEIKQFLPFYAMRFRFRLSENGKGIDKNEVYAQFKHQR